jgi:hypothetical protein
MLKPNTRKGASAITLHPDMVQSQIGVFSTRIQVKVEDGVVYTRDDRDA